MSEVALPQPVPNISSTAAMASASDRLCNGQTSFSQPQSQTKSQPHSLSRKRPFDGIGNLDEGKAFRDSNENETQEGTDTGISAEVIANTVGSEGAGSIIGQDSKERAQPSISSTASTSAIDATTGISSLQKEDATSVKRRKVTPQEKEEKRLEKEERERERADMRARKDKEKRLKDEEKRKKEEEKKLKEDNKRKKAEEREEERKMKEEERRKKEEEKEEKKRERDAERLMIEEEKRKKEKAQPKLHSFFVKPKDPAPLDSPGKQSASAKFHNDDCKDYDAQQNGDLGFRLINANTESNNGSPQKSSGEKSKTAAHQSTQSDYERFFLPFTLQSHTVCAPYNQFLERRTAAGRSDACSLFSSAQLEPGRLALRTNEVNDAVEEGCAETNEADKETRDVKAGEEMISGKALIRGLAHGEELNLDEVPDDANYFNGKDITNANRTRGYPIPCVRDLMTRLRKDPIDLTNSEKDTYLTKSSHQSTLINTLRALPVKYLRFAEDVRPPYFGTFTRLQSPAAARSLSRNPLGKKLPETNYEYDSEAEWEEPEEGEDLQSDEEDEDEEEDGDGEDDIATFLDDEEVEGMGMGGKRRMPLGSGDLEPICSGLWWEDERGTLVAADASSTTDKGNRGCTEVDFSAFKMGYLIDRRTHSIDPYSTAYWPSMLTAGAATTAAATTSTHLSASSSSAMTSLLNPATLLKQHQSATTTQPSLLTNGMSKKNIRDSNNRQRCQPLHSRPTSTIVKGGIAVYKDKNNETGPETDIGQSKNPVMADGDRRTHTNAEKTQTGSGAGGGSNHGNAKAQKRFVTPEELPAFCAAIEGSCLTKIALVEELKRKFPKIPKDAISNSVGAVAERKGAKEVEKRWVLQGLLNL